MHHRLPHDCGTVHSCAACVTATHAIFRLYWKQTNNDNIQHSIRQLRCPDVRMRLLQKHWLKHVSRIV